MTPTERAYVCQQRITDWQVSGVSGSAYCKQQSLIYHQFVYWRRMQALRFTNTRPPVKEIAAVSRRKKRRIEMLLYPSQLKIKTYRPDG